MEALREFLESSTIHGLSYISTAPTKASKALWLAIVVTGFCTAGYLINSSYKEWQASPVSTSITTHPISELDFPTITVCPPEGCNTVLNYDLMTAVNMTLTDQDMRQLNNLCQRLLIDNPAASFVKLAQDMTNYNNILNLFNGRNKIKQTFPYYDRDEKTKEPLFRIYSSQFNGSFSSPGFGDTIDCNQTYHGVHFTLMLPLVDMKLGGNETLQLNIQVKNSN